MSLELRNRLQMVDCYDSRVNRAAVESNFSAVGTFDNEPLAAKVRSGDDPLYSHRDMQLAVDRAFAFGVEQGNVSKGIGGLLAGAIGASTWWLLFVWAL